MSITKGYKIHIKSGAMDIPKDLLFFRAIAFKGIPKTTLKGLIYVLFGQRPPSYRKTSMDYEVALLSKLSDNALYKIENVGKIEDYFGRKTQFTLSKNSMPGERYMRHAVGSNFVTSLKEVFETNDAIEAFRLFSVTAKNGYDRKADIDPETRMAAIAKIDFLRQRASNYGENWKLSPGYLSPFYSRTWLARPSVLSNEPRPYGVIGSPKKKYVFDATVFLPTENLNDDEIDELQKLLAISSSAASFGKGGLAWVDFNGIHEIDISFAQSGVDDGDIFTRIKKE